MRIGSCSPWLLLPVLLALPCTRAAAKEVSENAAAKTLRSKAKLLHSVCVPKARSEQPEELKRLQKLIDKLLKNTGVTCEAPAHNALCETKEALELARTAAESNKLDWQGLRTAYEAASTAIQSLRDEDAMKAELGKKLRNRSQGVAEILGAASLCDDYCTPGRFINVCAFAEDLDLAKVAVAVDPDAVEELFAVFDEATATAKTGALRRDDDSSGGAQAIAQALVPGLGTGEIALRFAVGLGKLAVDRAKQEAVLWALDRIGARFCGRRDKVDVLMSEVREYWLPQLCTLTVDENLRSGFGAGQAMLTALISAIEEDATNLPSVAVGLSVGTAYWAEDLPGERRLFDCGVADRVPDPPTCARVKRVRNATSKAIAGLLDGAEPAAQVRDWAATIDDVNRIKLGENKYALAAPANQIAICGVSLAAELSVDGAGEAEAKSEEGPLPIRYRVLAGLVAAPACWTLTGEGYTSANYSHSSSNAGTDTDTGTGTDTGTDTDTDTDTGTKTKTEPSRHLALDRAASGDVERLSTLIRLASLMNENRRRLVAAWQSVARVEKRLRGARERLKKARKDAKSEAEVKVKTLGALAKIKITELDRGALDELLDEAKLDTVRARLEAVLDVAEEIIAAAHALAAVLDDISRAKSYSVKLWPGLQEAKGETRAQPTWVSDEGALSASVKEFRRALGATEEVLDALRELLGGDWAVAMMRALAVVRDVPQPNAEVDLALAEELKGAATLLELMAEKGDAEAKALRKAARELRVKARALRRAARKAGGSSASASQSAEQTPLPREETLQHLGELVGLFAALLSAKDSDDVAEILEKTASPAGGWRRKQAKGALSLSIASHVGVMAAVEFRRGQYGVHFEHGAPHLQAPTLTVPIGFDLTGGTGRNSLGGFASVIDPAAFLQYDVGEGGRLPGPRPHTVLAPGLFFRWGIFRTPLTLLVGYVYRPRLRTWEATVHEPGADAHQIGLSLAIDATLWNIVKR